MSEKIGVNLEAFHELPHLAIAVFQIRLLRLTPQPESNSVLYDSEAAQFFYEAERHLHSILQTRVLSIAPEFKVAVSCSEARLGSLEFTLVVFFCPYTAPAVTGVALAGLGLTVIKNYPKLREAVVIIVEDINKSLDYLEEQAIRIWKWLNPQKLPTSRAGQGEMRDSSENMKNEQEKKKQEQEAHKDRLARLEQRVRPRKK